MLEEEAVHTVTPIDLTREGPMLIPLKRAADALGVTWSMLATLTSGGDIEQVRKPTLRQARRIDGLLSWHPDARVGTHGGSPLVRLTLWCFDGRATWGCCR